MDKLRDNRYETLMGYVMSYINKEKTGISDLSRTDKKLLRGICIQNFSSFAKEDRIAVGRLLKDMGEFRKIDRKIHSNRKNDRLDSIRIIGYAVYEEFVPELLKMLFDADADIRYASARALVLIDDNLYMPYIMNSLTDSRYYNPKRIAEIFGLIEDYTEVLDTIYSQSDPRYKLAAIMVMGSIRDTAYIPTLVDAACMENKEIKVRAINSLLEIGFDVSDYLDRLKYCDNSAYWEVRSAYAKLLSNVDSDEAVTQLSHMIEDESWWVRVNSAASMLRHGAYGIDMLKSIADGSSDRFARELALQYLERYVWRGQYA